jgi:broad specificity phosphatase PhoE
MKLIIVRHAETVENVKGIIQGHRPGKLSEKGIEQTKKLARILRSERILNIYSSDLARAIDTTNEIKKYHPGVPVRYLKLLRERNLGELEGKSRDELLSTEIYPNSGILKTAEGESIEDLFSRASQILELIYSAHPDDTVLLVMHGGAGKALISILENSGQEGYASLPRLENASISIYHINSSMNFQKVVFNNTDHLF